MVAIMFQSLFFWIHFYNHPIAHRPLQPIVFQSLFFWIHFYNTTKSGGSASPPAGFNPCFSGFTSTTVSPRALASCWSVFQSLFFWIHFYNRAALCCH